MADTTHVGWTNRTHNAWWVCTAASPACAHCYAEAMAYRFGWAWGARAPRRVWPHDSPHWQAPYRWNRIAARTGVRSRVFTGSMSDIMDTARDLRNPTTIGPTDPPAWDLDYERAYLWQTIAATRWLDWQLLTKRPEQYLHLLPVAWFEQWPGHVWLGTTTENAEQASLRWVWIIDLVERCRVRPPVLFASVEPILSAIDFTALRPLTVERVTKLLCGLYPPEEATAWAVQWREKWDTYVVRYGNGHTLDVLGHGFLDWIITGGESGRYARPWHPAWVRQLHTQAHAHGIAFFHKQHGAWSPVPIEQCQSHTHFADAPEGPVSLYWAGIHHKTGNVLDGQRWETIPAPIPPVLSAAG